MISSREKSKADCLCAPTTMPPPVPPTGTGMRKIN